MKGNIVRYNFLGLDTHDKEVFRLDYAIVLNESSENGMVKILPITNRFNKESMESFCIGNVDGFVEVKNEGFVENSQYVRFDKILEVHEDELYPVYKQDSCGNMILDGNDNKCLVSVNDFQRKKIEEKYARYEEGEERCAYNVITKAGASYDIDYGELENNPLAELGFKTLDKYREYNWGDQKILVFFHL